MVKWPEDFQQRFHIFAHGEKFDVDRFLAESSLRPDFEWRRDPPLTSGVEFLLGDGRAMRLVDQENAALIYLKAHRNDLRAIAGFSGIEGFILGLVYIAKLGGGVTGVALDWDRELMVAALDVGITPIHYVTYEYPPRPDHEPHAEFCLAG